MICKHCGKKFESLFEQGKSVGDKYIMLICWNCAEEWGKFLDDELHRHGLPSYIGLHMDEKTINRLWLEIRELWHPRKPKVKVMLI
jgi:hypothetical protein